MVEVTVGLPLFNAKNIAWLCLESFCKQEEVAFDWELIVIEEQDSNHFGKQAVMKYESLLKLAGCVKIIYIPIQKWMPLGQKWKTMIDHSDENSKCFIWSAADCYSEPKRFKKAYEKINKQNFDWVCDKLGLFFDITSKKHILYADRDNQQRAGLSSSTKMELMRKLPDNDIAKKVDGFVFQVIKPQRICNIFEGENNDWKYGLNTHGQNNISTNRGKYFTKIKFPFEPTQLKIDTLLPLDIVSRLYKM